MYGGNYGTRKPMIASGPWPSPAMQTERTVHGERSQVLERTHSGFLLLKRITGSCSVGEGYLICHENGRSGRQRVCCKRFRTDHKGRECRFFSSAQLKVFTILNLEIAYSLKSI